jgi:large subunit ribosomal protein L20
MRVKRGVTSRAKHNKLFRANKGYRMTKRRLIRVAKEAHLHAGEYAFAGRKNKKRDFRGIWISRISHAVTQKGMSYSVFMHELKKANIVIDRKMLSYLVTEQPEAFTAIFSTVKGA